MDGVTLGVEGFCIDTTELKQAHEHIQLRERYLSALSRIGHLLLASHSEIPFDPCLAVLGEAASAGRSYVFLNHRDDDGILRTSQMAEWCDEGVEAQFGDPRLQNMAYREKAPDGKACSPGARPSTTR